MKKYSLLIILPTFLLSACGEFSNQDVGVLAGGAAGGLLGSQFGGGTGKIAAAVGGALVGAYLGGKIGQTMDRLDRLEMQKALESAPTGRSVHWQNPDNGNQYTVEPTRTYYNNQQACREYRTTAIIGGKSEQVHGTACRQADGSWKVAN
ncbi:MAG: RT0821/Lpp0805 family surface protein [Legionellaceae bacterium]|nr:RT0821/Lpp0805 family surface protein [Legionellaceae bacterium]